MEPSTVPVTISYRKAGLRAPVFVAGSFTEPAWHLHEMRLKESSEGDTTFIAQFDLVPGKEYQYKFKIGDGDHGQWMLDERSPIVTDTTGNQNNLLQAPVAAAMPSTTSAEAAPSQRQPLVASLAAALQIDDSRNKSRTPVEQVAATAAEVADTAQMLDRDSPSSGYPDDEDQDDDAKDLAGAAQEIRCPLFSHESLGAYEFVDDGFDHEESPISVKPKHPKSASGYAFDNIDLNDPTIEKFPSDKSSIIDALRRLQSSTSEDPARHDDFISPHYAASSVPSLDSGDEGFTSPGSLSPTSTRRRDSRFSQSSFGRTKSAASLGSIAEEDQREDEPANNGSPPPVLHIPLHNGEALLWESPVAMKAANEDSLFMRSKKPSHADKATSVEKKEAEPALELNHIEVLSGSEKAPAIELDTHHLDTSSSDLRSRNEHPSEMPSIPQGRKSRGTGTSFDKGKPAPPPSPWTRIMDTRTATFIAIGAALLGLGIALLRNVDKPPKWGFDTGR
ncbi:hypothetical protein B0I35DRAFT_37985 [Stachybotrys elegans]|uniref:AMP-activated protein kinase glycogen-binding domain-containing protein n=1 Tax=Stachybotrys elegans TaxID=80388 RepID=A0A8K0WWY9_9HYPO|nr:hypothetical protein B0I35DRAFT_37985 [Stachybotrys elegans]